MPFFPTSHEFAVNDAQMNDVQGTATIHNNSNTTRNVNSGNTTITNIKDSYNNHSTNHIQYGDTHNNNHGNGVFNNVSGNQYNETPQGSNQFPISKKAQERHKAKQRMRGHPSPSPSPLPAQSPAYPHQYAREDPYAPLPLAQDSPPFRSNNPFAPLAAAAMNDSGYIPQHPSCPHQPHNGGDEYMSDTGYGCEEAAGGDRQEDAWDAAYGPHAQAAWPPQP